MKYNNVINEYENLKNKAANILKNVFEAGFDYVESVCYEDNKLKVTTMTYYDYEGYADQTFYISDEWLDYDDAQLAELKHVRDLIHKVYYTRKKEVALARYNKKNQKWIEKERQKNKDKWDRIEKAVKTGKKVY